MTLGRRLAGSGGPASVVCVCMCVCVCVLIASTVWQGWGGEG